MLVPSSGSVNKSGKRPAEKQIESSTAFLPGLFFDPEDGCDMYRRNVGWLSNGLHGIISQKMELFKRAAVRTLNLKIFI
jgi:hypothetical protein